MQNLKSKIQNPLVPANDEVHEVIRGRAANVLEHHPLAHLDVHLLDGVVKLCFALAVDQKCRIEDHPFGDHCINLDIASERAQTTENKCGVRIAFLIHGLLDQLAEPDSLIIGFLGGSVDETIAQLPNRRVCFDDLA